MKQNDTVCNICFIVCVGIPASGKTTFCAKLQEIWKNLYNFIYINYDDYSAGDFTSNKRKQILELVEGKVSLLHNEKPTLILLDDNMYYKSMRLEYERLAKKYSSSFLQLYFKIELEVAIERNEVRRDKVPQEVICSMFQKLEAPEKRYSTIDSNFNFDGASLEDLHKIVENALEVKLVQEKYDVHSVPIEESKMHKIDIILRKFVAQKMKEDKSNVAYVHKKKEIFMKIKQGEILISEGLNGKELELYFSTYFID